MKKSILLVNPAYQYSFFLKDELRKRGWKADVYKPNNYPDKLLYADDYICEKKSKWKIIYFFQKLLFFISILIKYKFFLVYGGTTYPEIFSVIPRKYINFLSKRFSPELILLNILNKKLLCFPNGCLQEVLRKDFVKHEDGNVCANCGWSNRVCDDEQNQFFFDIRNKYFDFTIANTPIQSNRIEKHLIKERTIDLDIYHPDIDIPKSFKLPKTNNLRILHSFYNKNREHGNKNIKGSPYILEAINRLKNEDYPVEYFYLNDIPSKHMRFYQVQADIVVEQLIYGWWGSTGIETMALGKPVVCYITPSWKKTFLETFPEYDDLPIVEANTETIYEVLKKLVVDENYRKQKGRESRSFAEQHFDAKRNAAELERIFLGL